MPNLADYIQFKSEQLATLRDTLRAPEARPSELVATARVAGGSGVRPVHVREFTIVTDSAPALAGYNLGPTAPELLMSALASCLAHTFLIVAASRGVAYETLEVEVRGSIDFRGVLEVADVPTRPNDISYEARICSTLDAATLVEIQRDVERLCPVLQALTEPLAVQGAVTVVE